ncbi:MAG: hypothetical protein DMF59_18905 [Acidobacteria bacterium]|nr:MAG: hypothetical protein DMF59_18905 [Acidobacteriota bacterium]
MRRIAIVLCFTLTACGSPTEPRAIALGNGKWSGDGGCLSVTDSGCDFAAGCGHGQFPKPTIRADGTFDVDGTYRVEVGPISINPAPPAHFSGSIAGDTLTLNVVPTSGTVLRPTFSMKPTTAGPCPIPCV